MASYMQGEGELQAVYDKLYKAEQHAAWLEVRLEYWQTRCEELKQELESRDGASEERECEQCGLTFRQRKKGRTKRFCSAACRQQHYKEEKAYRDLSRKVLSRQ